MCVESVIENDYDERKNGVKIIESILKKNKMKLNKIKSIGINSIFL